MKRHALFFALLCWFTLFFATTSHALTIPASEDSYTAPRNTLSYSTNNASALFVDATRKSYLYFDLSDIPSDAVVRWAKLRLFLPTVRTPGAGLSVHLVTGTWNESTRLANVPSIVAGSLGMIAPDKMASRRFVTVDVKDTVQKWINGGTLNEGFAIQPIVKAGSPTASVMLTSKEGPVFGLPAELDIEFGPTFDTLPLSIRSYFGPTITAQPIAPVSGIGDSLMVSASGMGPLRYQWVRDGSAITGATAERLPSAELRTGSYAVIVRNEFTSITSDLIWLSEPKIFSHPEGAIAKLGTNVTLAVRATGTEPLSFQWRKNQIPLVGENNSSLIIENIKSEDAGYYDVVVGNVIGAVTSNSTELSVNIFRSMTLLSGGTLPFSSPLGACYVRPFYIGDYEVTWGEWKNVRTWAIANGYSELEDVGQGIGENYPVSSMNWNDALKWCNARSEKEGKRPCYILGDGTIYRTGLGDPQIDAPANGYRLPSEAEWEFAARGGVSTKGYTYSGSNDINSVAWYSGNSVVDGKYAVHEIGMKLKNELGLYDMSGNLSEWCFTTTRSDRKAVRGGAFWLPESYSKIDNQSVSNPIVGAASIGFRVAASLLVDLAVVEGGQLPVSSPIGDRGVGSFLIGKTEVTWGQWRTIKNLASLYGYHDILWDVATGLGDNHPVTYVSWYDAVKWCNALSEIEGSAPVYYDGRDGSVFRNGTFLPFRDSQANGYRLPSEAEWEFAARGGKQTRNYFYSGSNNLDSVAWYRENSGLRVQEVGRKTANELGLYDMSGNALEWCFDDASSILGRGPFGPLGPAMRVVRGGHCRGEASSCAITNVTFDDFDYMPGSVNEEKGFRVVKTKLP